ncbi:MAG: uridine kinase, partial [Bacillota bacterium]|nr:uridine kinase [Bacillota bacterium]
MIKPLVIGIAGGTGSGKSTVANSIFKKLPEKNISILEQDAYYKNQDGMLLEMRKKTNYDHPLAFDTELLIEHIISLNNNIKIKKPIYDFENHTRKIETIDILPKEILIVEGIMVLEDKRIRDLMDIKIFVDTDADVRIIRRIMRDIKERGRTLESVIEQYFATVKPAHDQFVEPSKKYADIIIPEGGLNKVAINVIVSNIE